MNLNQVPLALPLIGDELRKAEIEEFDRIKEKVELQYKQIRSVHCPEERG